MEVVGLYLRLQLLLTIFMVVLLWSLYVRLQRQEFFCWWAWAGTSFAIFLALRTLVLQYFAPWTAVKAGLLLVISVCGFLQIPLLVFGAWSLLRARPPERRTIFAGLGLAFTAGLLFFALSALWRDQRVTSFVIRAVPRTVALAAALLFCTYVFFRQWWRSRSWACGIVAAFCLLWAVNQSIYAWYYGRRLLLHLSTVSPSPSFGVVLITSPLLYFLDIAYVFGICLGMVLLLVEEHERTQHALWESDNRRRQVAASNAELQAEIEERKRVEAALRESEDCYRDLVENSQDLLCTHDLKGKLLSVNPAPARILGYTVEELLRLTLPELIAPEFREQFAAYISQIRKHGAATGYLCLLTRSGEPRVWEYHNTLRTEGIPEPIVRGLAHDVTERKLAERALHNSEEQLRQAQKMEAVGRLAGGIAHDFNNFLLAITLNLEQALRRLGPKDYGLLDYLDEALNAALSASSVTRRLLTFSRRGGFQAQPVNLNDVVSTTKELLDRLGGENIHLHLLLQNDLGRVKSDPVQLQQVILNLMLNARDAMPRGGHITIRTENFDLKDVPIAEQFTSVPGPGAYVVLEVSDTGAGMDKAALSHLFEPFFTTKEAGTAAGLGLPICYGIVTQSEGHISVRSQPGQGTTVRVYLPRLQGRCAEDQPPAAAVPAVYALHLHPARMALVVDDAEAVRNAVARDLREIGYSVLVAADAAEAILLSDQRKGPIHLLIVDVIMPGMDGRELARYLRRKRPDLKVLFMSGYDQDTLAAGNAKETGETLLYKPFGSLELFAALGKVLDQEAA